MKFIDILKSANANLFRNKSRTILTIIAIFIGAFTISLTVGINIGVNDYVDKQLSGVGDASQMIIYPKQEIGMEMNGDKPQEYQADKKEAQQQKITEKDFKKLRALKSLKEVEPMTNFNIDYIQGLKDKKFVMQAGSSLGNDMELTAGNQIDNTVKENEIVIAENFVKELGFKDAKSILNQEVTLGVTETGTGKQEQIKATIVGVRAKSIVQGGMSVVNQNLAEKLVTINETGLPEKMQNQVYAATATLAKNVTPQEVVKVKNKLSDEGFEAQTMEDQIGIIKNVVNGITGVLTMFGGIALLAASFGIINTLYMSVQERTREIGLMKAMGMSRGKIFSLFSFEALLIGFWGSIIGLAGAYGVGQLINQFAVKSFLKGLEGLTLVEFNLQSVLTIVGIIMLIAFLAGTFPAKRAAKLDPITALKYE
ncbi:ABC transporter permease [Vagococcus sp.]|uniref:ABC transporter permease n=1 Tax=Vagococcus sp. TaxID=1933889 RepID=UPI003F990DF3